MEHAPAAPRRETVAALLADWEREAQMYERWAGYLGPGKPGFRRVLVSRAQLLREKIDELKDVP
jgi:hypothetical protein